jgi:hypothetical protein
LAKNRISDQHVDHQRLDEHEVEDQALFAGGCRLRAMPRRPSEAARPGEGAETSRKREREAGRDDRPHSDATVGGRRSLLRVERGEQRRHGDEGESQDETIPHEQSLLKGTNDSKHK